MAAGAAARTFVGGIAPSRLAMGAAPLVIFGANATGLLPFVPATSGAAWLAGFGGLLFWGAPMISIIIRAPQRLAASLVPSGAPRALVPFLVVVEAVRVLIRPLTLALRLLANITAGHVILALLATAALQ